MNVRHSEVVTVADARRSLSEILRRYRADPDADTVIIGSHRKPEAAIVPFRVYSASAAGPRLGALDELRRRRELVHRIAALNHLGDVAVFGSVARGEETESSDIDLLVTPGLEASLFDLAQFEVDMAQLTGREVDVVSRRALDAERDAAILAEAVEL